MPSEKVACISNKNNIITIIVRVDLGISYMVYIELIFIYQIFCFTTMVFNIIFIQTVRIS